MNCPVCSAATQPEMTDGVEADVCPQGHGLWVSTLEVLRLVRAHDPGGRSNSYAEHESLSMAAGIETSAADDSRPCPVCDTSMAHVEYGLSSGVHVDVCARHGVWLDQGERERLVAWFADAGMKDIDRRERALQEFDEDLLDRPAPSSVEPGVFEKLGLRIFGNR